MLKKLSSVFLFFFFILTLTGCGQKTSTVESEKSIIGETQTIVASNKKIDNYQMSSSEIVVDKLEVYYFHRTARCYSCKTIGQYVKETIEEKYSNQVGSGKIDFREINVDSAENKAIVEKYKATGSSLFINRIINNQDNIEQDTDVWLLLNDEIKFKSHLENKLNSYLGL